MMRNLTAHEKRMAYRRQAELLRALAHPARLRLLTMLVSSPACVGELVEKTGFRQPYISQHLATLREAGLVTGTRDGVTIRYEVTCPRMEQLLLDVRATCQLPTEMIEQQTER